MSINEKQTIKCPKCGQMSELTIWESITVSDSHDLKEDLLKGNINVFRCSSCGQTALFPSPILYQDEKQKLLISFAPENDIAEKTRLFEEVKASSKRSGELDKFLDYNLRFVTSYNELLEKILIFDNGFHDKVIEIIKLLILSQDSDKMIQRSCMFGKLDGNEIEFLVQDKKENQIYTSRVPLDTYKTIETQLKQSGAKFKSFNWEIVDLDLAANLLRGINNTL